jgi:hypothetical protein
MIGNLKYVVLFTILVAAVSSIPSVPSDETFITVDRGCGSSYYAGESILITYSVKAEPSDTVLITIKEILPDSTLSVLISNRQTEPNTLYTMRMFAQPIYGRETLLLEYVVKSDSESSWHATECSFHIKEGNYETGSLKIQCNQTGFDMYLDDAFVAHSESETVQIDGIIGGGHTLKVTKPGCKDYVTPVTINPGRTVTLEIDMDCAIRDRDGDLIPDSEDQCNNPLCDLVDEKGCPLDSDGDGVNDCEDICPEEQGDRESRGCAYGDSDGDGVADNVDLCDNPECAVVDDTGCPKDTDADGISDCEDDCPLEGGDTQHSGCPERDSDGDGIGDDEDRCYNPDCMTIDTVGCPLDTDGDTVLDCEDACPQEPGTREDLGCPPPEKDTGVAGGFLVITGIVLVWLVRRATR